jgi:hypothetical protein
MKYLLIIDDTVTVTGPGVDVRVVTDPPVSSLEEMRGNPSLALALGQAALGVVHNVLEIGSKMAGPVGDQQLRLDPPRDAAEN